MWNNFSKFLTTLRLVKIFFIPTTIVTIVFSNVNVLTLFFKTITFTLQDILTFSKTTKVQEEESYYQHNILFLCRSTISVPPPINCIIPDDAIDRRKLGFQFFFWKQQFKASLEQQFCHNILFHFAQ